MKPSEKLSAAKALIADPENWTQRANARDAYGEEVHHFSPYAVSFCAVGAFKRVMGEEFCTTTQLFNVYMNAIDFLANVSRPKTPELVNDSEDHAAVMKMFDRAIELAEKEECK